MMKIKKQNRKKFVTKRKLKFEDYKHCLGATQLENKITQLEKNTKLMCILSEKITKNS